MLSKNVKKWVAVFLIFALCAGLCPGAKEGKAAEPVSSDYIWYDDDELILPVYLSDNKEWMDEKGFVYCFDDTKKTAQITRIKLSYYLGDKEGSFDHAPGDIVLRPPDKVICNGETYVVTSLSIIGDDDKVVRIHLYIGKYITWVALYSLDIKVTSYVHYANKKYVSDRGSLFTADRKELCRFCDETYGADETYVVPKSVQIIGQWAFFRAEIGEVRLNDNITWIYPYAFQDSYIHRVDLDQVEMVGDGAFSGCPFLEEVTFGKENVKFGIGAFSDTPALKNVYIPDWCTIGEGAFESSGIETLIMGKGVQMDAGEEPVAEGYNMGECYNLKTVVLSQNMTSLPLKAFTDCHSLKKLYIPERVGEIGEDCFYRTPVNIYGETGSAAEDVVKDNVNFTSLDGHEHNLEEVTFFSFDTWAAVGSYCRDCGYAEDVRISYKKNLPAMLIQEEEIYSEPCVELNEENTDPDGILYELDESTLTAEVKGVNTGGEHPGELLRGIIWIPGKVIKDEKEYVVETMGNSALWGGRASTVVLPDTVKELGSSCFGNTVKKIVLGEGIEDIHETAFANIDELEWIEIRGENPNFTVEGNALYNKDKTELIRVMNCGEGTTCEFTVPDTVSSIWEYAFVQNRWNCVFSLIRIHIPARNKIKQLRDTDRWFAHCYACIRYMNERWYKADAPIWLPDFIKPTSSPAATPSISPTLTLTPDPASATPWASDPPQNPSATPAAGSPVSPTEIPAAGSPVSPSETSAAADFFPINPAMISSAAVPASESGLESDPDAKAAGYRQELAVSGFQSSLTGEGYVKLVWKRNTRAKCYRIYRAFSKNGKYELIRMVSKTHLTYTDKSVRADKKYFYKITALGVFDNKLVEGEESSISMVRISGMRIPQISVKKGKLGKVRYITVTFKKYAGKNADIYISIGKQKKFKKLKLVSSKIDRYKGKFKIRCMVENQEIRVKVRTYKKDGGKKVYSGFSQVARVRM